MYFLRPGISSSSRVLFVFGVVTLENKLYRCLQPTCHPKGSSLEDLGSSANEPLMKRKNTLQSKHIKCAFFSSDSGHLSNIYFKNPQVQQYIGIIIPLKNPPCNWVITRVNCEKNAYRLPCHDVEEPTSKVFVSQVHVHLANLFFARTRTQTSPQNLTNFIRAPKKARKTCGKKVSQGGPLQKKTLVEICMQCKRAHDELSTQTINALFVFGKSRKSQNQIHNAINLHGFTPSKISK